MKRPVIGITTNYITMEGGKFAGMKRVYVNKDYTDAVLQSGGIPLLIPPVNENEAIEKYINQCDGFIFSGGADLNPVLYGENPHPALEPYYTDMDRAHLCLIAGVMDADKPLLAICRGMQLLNVACRGTLYQDVSEISEAVHCHNQPSVRSERIHYVSIKEGSKLYEIFGQQLFVNSYHHQMVKALGNDLIITAHSPDGVIEGIEIDSKRFVVGVQWHPEMLLTESKDMLPLFEALIENSRK